MKHATTVLVALLLLAISVVQAEPVPSGTYAGTPAGTSSGEVLWSQLDDPSGSGFTDQAFEVGYAAYDSSGAEDFIVEVAGGTGLWDLDTLFTPGSLTVVGSNPFFVYNAFYEDAGGLPGAAHFVCDFPAYTSFTSDGNGNLTIDVSGCYLPEGTHWFSQQVRMDFDPLGQHYWATRIGANNNPGLWKNPGNGFGNGCLDWQPANAVCGMTGDDFLFELSGESVIWPPDIPAIGPFGAVVLILALGGGSAYVLRRRAS